MNTSETSRIKIILVAGWGRVIIFLPGIQHNGTKRTCRYLHSNNTTIPILSDFHSHLNHVILVSHFLRDIECSGTRCHAQHFRTNPMRDCGHFHHQIVIFPPAVWRVPHSLLCFFCIWCKCTCLFGKFICWEYRFLRCLGILYGKTMFGWLIFFTF